MSAPASTPPAWRSAPELVARPAWSPAEVTALTGRCKGSLMRDWAVHVARRYGADGVAAVRADAGVSPLDVPDQPARDGWYRVAHQVALTRAITDRFLGGDLAALEALLREDALRVQDRWVLKVMRLAISPRRILAGGEKLHAALYDQGHLAVEVERHAATYRFHGARYFAEPTWGALQIFAMRGLFLALRAPLPVIRGQASEDGLILHLTY